MDGYVYIVSGSIPFREVVFCEKECKIRDVVRGVTDAFAQNPPDMDLQEISTTVDHICVVNTSDKELQYILKEAAGDRDGGIIWLDNYKDFDGEYYFSHDIIEGMLASKESEIRDKQDRIANIQRQMKYYEVELLDLESELAQLNIIPVFERDKE